MQKLLGLAYFYLRFRPRSVFEMQEYLEKKQKKFHLDPQDVSVAMEELKRQRLIDDAAFITWYVEVRGTSKKKSVRLLRFELQKHGVSSDDIERYYQERPIDEDAHALTALKKRWRSYDALDQKKRFARAAAYLQRMGFSYSQTKTAIAEMEKKG